LNNSFNELLGKYALRKDLEAPFKLQLNKFFKYANGDLFNSISILESEVVECDKKLKGLDERYWLSSVTLPVEKYKAFLEQIKTEKAQKELRLADLRKKLSNSEIFVNEAMEIARNIQQYWASSDLEGKMKIQKTVFPNGLVIVPSERRYLTRNVNTFFRSIPLFSRTLNWGKMKKVTISDDFSSLVAGTGLEPVAFGL
jgi:site-specific DNA recombinase